MAAVELVSVRVYTEYDEDPDLSWLEQDCMDDDGYGRNRIAAFERGEWHMLGIVAEATVSWDDVWDEDRCIARGGTEAVEASIWNVESDSDTSYVQEVAEGVLDELRACIGADPRFAHLCEFPDDIVEWQI